MRREPAPTRRLCESPRRAAGVLSNLPTLRFAAAGEPRDRFSTMRREALPGVAVTGADRGAVKAVGRFVDNAGESIRSP
jgi:hypothetical protein